MKLTEDYKYKSIRKTAEVLAELMSYAIPKDFGVDEDVIVIPLPTIARHIRERGFDHTRLLAKKLAEYRGWKMKTPIFRINKTVQVGADENTRKVQASKAYAVSGEVDPSKTYLLVDDVWTTGASMESAISLMKKAGAHKLASAVILMPPE